MGCTTSVPTEKYEEPISNVEEKPQSAIHFQEPVVQIQDSREIESETPVQAEPTEGDLNFYINDVDIVFEETFPLGICCSIRSKDDVLSLPTCEDQESLRMFKRYNIAENLLACIVCHEYSFQGPLRIIDNTDVDDEDWVVSMCDSFVDIDDEGNELSIKRLFEDPDVGPLSDFIEEPVKSRYKYIIYKSKVFRTPDFLRAFICKDCYRSQCLREETGLAMNLTNLSYIDALIQYLPEKTYQVQRVKANNSSYSVNEEGPLEDTLGDSINIPQETYSNQPQPILSQSMDDFAPVPLKTKPSKRYSVSVSLGPTPTPNLHTNMEPPRKNQHHNSLHIPEEDHSQGDYVVKTHGDYPVRNTTQNTVQNKRENQRENQEVSVPVSIDEPRASAPSEKEVTRSSKRDRKDKAERRERRERRDKEKQARRQRKEKQTSTPGSVESTVEPEPSTGNNNGNIIENENEQAISREQGVSHVNCSIDNQINIENEPSNEVTYEPVMTLLQPEEPHTQQSISNNEKQDVQLAIEV